MAERPERCEACRFWSAPGDGKPESDDLGNCHRRAPRPETADGVTVWWPLTAAGDWCGEFSPAPAGQSSLDEAVLAERRRCLRVVNAQPYYPHTEDGMRQQWVKDQIAARIADPTKPLE